MRPVVVQHRVKGIFTVVVPYDPKFYGHIRRVVSFYLEGVGPGNGDLVPHIVRNIIVLEFSGFEICTMLRRPAAGKVYQ